MSVPGLDTPQLKGEERALTSANTSRIESKDSVFDIALELENNLEHVLQQVEKHDEEINKRIDQLSERIQKLEKDLQGQE